MSDPDLPPWIAAYRDPLDADERPVALMRRLHTLRGLPPTARLRGPWREELGDGWVFHFNGRPEATLCDGSACLGRHILAHHNGEPVLLINADGGWGTPADRDAFCFRLEIFIQNLMGEAA